MTRTSTGPRVPVIDAAALRAHVLAPVSAARAEHDEHLTRARADLAAVHTEAARIRAEHEAACADARARHTTLPPAPDVPDATPAQELVHRLMRQRPDLARLERDTLAAAAPDVEAAWVTARAHLGEEASTLLAAVEALAATYARWWNLVRDARRAVEDTNPGGRIVNGPSARMGKRPDALAVLAAGHGADLCAVTDLPGPLPPSEW